MKKWITASTFVIFTLLALNPHRASAGDPCEKLTVLWQSFAAKILKTDEYAEQKRNELSARLGRSQEFISRKKIEPTYLKLERPFTDGSGGHQTQLILGHYQNKRVLIKIFWQSAENLDSEIGGAIIQDFLSEMELSPKVYGIILDADKLRDLKNLSQMPIMVGRDVRARMYLALVMEYIPQSFNIPNGRFMPTWYIPMNKEEIEQQVTRMERVLGRIGIKRATDSDYLVTETQRIYAMGFSTEAFNPDQKLPPAANDPITPSPTPQARVE
jgi:hypothetical protein